ncbi:hypothetical protein CULT_2400003 [[Clostridium] ultunense Esp]|nr:hypothetical protein CULT_2400003 [[Clostridium] ultunense Esp]
MAEQFLTMYILNILEKYSTVHWMDLLKRLY